MTQSARCPRCNRKSSTPHAGCHVWYCHVCRMAFEAIDDGDVGYGRPSRRLEREERRREKKSNSGRQF